MENIIENTSEIIIEGKNNINIINKNIKKVLNIVNSDKKYLAFFAFIDNKKEIINENKVKRIVLNVDSFCFGNHDFVEGLLLLESIERTKKNFIKNHMKKINDVCENCNEKDNCDDYNKC